MLKNRIEFGRFGIVIESTHFEPIFDASDRIVAALHKWTPAFLCRIKIMRTSDF